LRLSKRVKMAGRPKKQEHEKVKTINKHVTIHEKVQELKDKHRPFDSWTAFLNTTVLEFYRDK
jgi:hypothetical protein